MQRFFESAAFSLPGTSHRKRGAESQDAAVLEKQDSFLFMAVSDGVGSCSESRVGAVTLTQALRKLFVNHHPVLVARAAELTPAIFAGRLAAWVQKELGKEIMQARDYLGHCRRSNQALSATIIGAFACEHAVAIFACGDGVVVVNDAVHVLKCDEKQNKPNLPIYGILDPTESCESQVRGIVRPIFAAPITEVSSIVLGTDGVEELVPFLRRETLGASRASSWVEDLFCRSLGLSANGSLPYDDATSVALWRSSSDGHPARIT